MSDIRVWRITPMQNLKLEINASTLDEITQSLPEGYYSTFRTFDRGSRVLGLTAHLRRLYDPVSKPEIDESVLRQQLYALLELYRPGEARVRAVMTKQGQVYLALAPLTPLPRAIYENGARVEITNLQRQYPRLKSTSFIDRSDSERKHIAQEGIFEALLVKDGKILEGMTSNFFYVLRPKAKTKRTQREIILHTAHEDILLGVTRETVIKIAQERGLEVKFQPLKLSQLEIINEAFITSSSRGIVPVIQIDQVRIGQGTPGLVTKDLMAAYESYIVENTEKI